MKFVLYFLSIVILAGLSVGIFQPLAFFGVVPNLLFLSVLVLALDKQEQSYLIYAIMAGVWLDFYSTVPIGSFSITFLIIASGVRFFVFAIVPYELHFRHILAISITAVALFYLLYTGYVLAFSSFANLPQLLTYKEVLLKLPYQVLYGIVCLYPVYVFMVGIRKFLFKLNPR